MRHTPQGRQIALEDAAAHAKGESFRSIAWRRGCHHSTIMRRVKRIEGIINRFHGARKDRELPTMEIDFDAKINQTARSVLRRLSEPEAELAVPVSESGMTCVVVRPGADKAPVVIGKVAKPFALEFFMRGWIETISRTTSVARYRITPKGKRELNALIRAHTGRASAWTMIDQAATLLRKPDGTPWFTSEQLEVAQHLGDVYFTEGEEAARLLLHHLDPGEAELVYAICCARELMGETERRLGLPARSGRVLLRSALSRLAKAEVLPDIPNPATIKA